MYQVKSPILFLIFNRPEETLLVFNEIKKVKPSVLYIAADGPRAHKAEDILLCEKTINIIKNIDWDCEVKTLLRQENIGCKRAVSSAITWFFRNEPEGIVLEDDCLPSQDFFVFCDEMLAYYRYNDKIAHICGSNFQDGIKRNEYSYYYSGFTYVWGWAGWRRVWEQYDVNLSLLEKGLKRDFLSVLTNSKIYKLFLEYIFKNVKNGKINTWDYQYLFLNIFNAKFSIVPNNNMISNIGFSKNATHSVSGSDNANIPFTALPYPVIHPQDMVVNKQADEYTLKKQTPTAFRVIVIAVKSYIKDVLQLNK
ncbi:MAG: hypothetical protein JWQ79_1236 [Mucilaginibacter sp.]|nr:hypothetical protein [Mucilaginibacter sp.]